MMTASHHSGWEDCRRRGLWYCIVIYGFVPVVFISSIAASRLIGSDAPFFIIMVSVAMPAVIVVVYRMKAFRCPRCHCSFFWGRWGFYAHRQKCAHCGLPKWSDVDETTPFDFKFVVRQKG